jgi:hypothetical protein
MPMDLTHDDEAEQRWAAAQAIADGEVDPPPMPRGSRTLWLWVAASVIGALLLGVLLGLVLPRSTPTATNDAGRTVRLIAAWVYMALGIVIGVTGFIWAVRTRRYITRRRAVAAPLSGPERQWVLTQIRTATHIEGDAKKSVVLAIAEQIRQSTLGLAPIYVGLAFIAVAVGMSTPVPVIAWAESVVVLGFIVTFGFMGREYRRTGRYIDSFGERPPVTHSAGSSS